MKERVRVAPGPSLPDHRTFISLSAVPSHIIAARMRFKPLDSGGDTVCNALQHLSIQIRDATAFNAHDIWFFLRHCSAEGWRTYYLFPNEYSRSINRDAKESDLLLFLSLPSTYRSLVHLDWSQLHSQCLEITRQKAGTCMHVYTSRHDCLNGRIRSAACSKGIIVSGPL